MKILYLTTSLGGGGAEKVVCDLADKMYEKGHQVVIAYLTRDIIVRPTCNEIQLINLDLNSPFQMTNSFKKYKSLILEFQPNIVHAHMVHANIFARLCRFFVKIPRLICTAHSNNEGGRVRMLAYRLTNGLSEVLTNVSDSACQSFQKQGAATTNQIQTVYNGIDLERYTFGSQKNFEMDKKNLQFLAVGRFHEAKDYPNLLHAIAIFRQHPQHKEYILNVVGDGELRPQIEELIEHLGLKDNVTLLGRRDDIPQLMQEADFFILSSAYEGFSLVVAEAMACGAFVIATNSGGVPEVMGDTGILIPPQDSKALAEAIKQAVSKTPIEIQENNLKARKRVEELFSLEKSVENWLKIYRNE
ncbi:glycosyltransferase [Alkanindiges illinoisensis]|uniref:Glycosyltransferase n=1 Tax=Alkanindiges illinoisensis TaxID=197183 RepID=A0A4Y7XCS9_9GAMM|nr:glycosyltransferase [Alkanindiges illinoisensis]TEU26820.1 glycosyltransferase [Alkanindiges illinoisensis]